MPHAATVMCWNSPTTANQSGQKPHGKQALIVWLSMRFQWVSGSVGMLVEVGLPWQSSCRGITSVLSLSFAPIARGYSVCTVLL